MSSNTEELQDPWLQAMTIYTISRDRQLYIPLRNLDICVQRSKKFLQDPNATFQVSGTNEQGQRAAIRQVAIDMKLNIVMASRYEQEVLKDSNVIGKRAPCAGLQSLEDAVTFLRVFGYPHVAASLLLKVQSIRALDLASEPGCPFLNVPSLYCDTVQRDTPPPFGRKNEAWVHQNSVDGMVTVLNLAATEDDNDETRPPVVQQLNVSDVLRVIGTAAYPIIPPLMIRYDEHTELRAGTVGEYLRWYQQRYATLMHSEASKHEPLDMLQNPDKYNSAQSLDQQLQEENARIPGVVTSRKLGGDTETYPPSTFGEYQSPMPTRAAPATDIVEGFYKTPKRVLDEGLVVLPPTPSSHTPRRHIQSSHHANAPPVDTSADQIHSPFDISLVFLKPVSVQAYQLDPPALSKSKKTPPPKPKKGRMYNDYDEKSMAEDDAGRRQTRGKIPSGGYAAMLQGRSEIETGLTGTRLSATDYPMVAAKVSNYHHKTRLTFNVPEPVVQIVEPAAKRRRRRMKTEGASPRRRLPPHPPINNATAAMDRDMSMNNAYSGISQKDEEWFKTPQEYRNYSNYTAPMHHHDSSLMYVNIPVYDENYNTEQQPADLLGDHLDSKLDHMGHHMGRHHIGHHHHIDERGHHHSMEHHHDHATDPIYNNEYSNTLGLAFPPQDPHSQSAYSESILSSFSDHSSTATTQPPLFDEPINLMGIPFDQGLIGGSELKASPASSPRM